MLSQHILGAPEHPDWLLQLCSRCRMGGESRQLYSGGDRLKAATVTICTRSHGVVGHGGRSLGMPLAVSEGTSTEVSVLGNVVPCFLQLCCGWGQRVLRIWEVDR